MKGKVNVGIIIIFVIMLPSIANANIPIQPQGVSNPEFASLEVRVEGRIIYLDYDVDFLDGSADFFDVYVELWDQSFVTFYTNLTSTEYANGIQIDSFSLLIDDVSYGSYGIYIELLNSASLVVDTRSLQVDVNLPYFETLTIYNTHNYLLMQFDINFYDVLVNDYVDVEANLYHVNGDYAGLSAFYSYFINGAEVAYNSISIERIPEGEYFVVLDLYFHGYYAGSGQTSNVTITTNPYINNLYAEITGGQVYAHIDINFDVEFGDNVNYVVSLLDNGLNNVTYSSNIEYFYSSDPDEVVVYLGNFGANQYQLMVEIYYNGYYEYLTTNFFQVGNNPNIYSYGTEVSVDDIYAYVDVDFPGDFGDDVTLVFNVYTQLGEWLNTIETTYYTYSYDIDQISVYLGQFNPGEYYYNISLFYLNALVDHIDTVYFTVSDYEIYFTSTWAGVSGNDVYIYFEVDTSIQDYLTIEINGTLYDSYFGTELAGSYGQFVIYGTEFENQFLFFGSVPTTSVYAELTLIYQGFELDTISIVNIFVGGPEINQIEVQVNGNDVVLELEIYTELIDMSIFIVSHLRNQENQAIKSSENSVLLTETINLISIPFGYVSGGEYYIQIEIWYNNQANLVTGTSNTIIVESTDPIGNDSNSSSIVPSLPIPFNFGSVIIGLISIFIVNTISRKKQII